MRAERVDVDTAAYQQALGQELRMLRRKRGWTRKDLQQRMNCEISLQTLATYELGTRQCTVLRLVELCLAMDEPAHELLERVHRRVFGERSDGRIKIDLLRVIHDDTPQLLPFRRWAKDRLSEGSGPTDISLDKPALDMLATLCDLTTNDLISDLRAIAGAPTPRPRPA
ncbi:MAG: helix-turn-helix domain-containing protein [Sciscionella sp.]